MRRRARPGWLVGRLWVLAVLLSHWRRRPGQLLTLVVGLVVATALWSGVEALNGQARASYDRAAQAFAATSLPSLVAVAEGDLDQRTHVDLRLAGWSVSPLLEGRVRIGGAPMRLLGIEPLSLPAEAGISVLAGAETAGTGYFQFVQPPGRTLAAPETLERLGLREGEVPRTEEGASLPPLVLSREVAPGLLVLDIGFAQAIMGREGKLSRLLLAGTGEAPPAAVLASHELRRVEPESSADLRRLTDSFHLNLTAFGMLAFLVGLFIVHSAIGLAVEQRLPMFRTLRACGVSARGLATVLAAELILIATLSGLAGVAAGYLVAGTLLPDVASTLRGLYGAEVSGVLSLGPRWWLQGLAISVAGALLAAGGSLARVWRMPVLESAAPHAWEAASRVRIARQGAGALALLALSALLAVAGKGLALAFAAMACLLLGAALGLPAVVGRALVAAERRSRGPLTRWFWADSRQQLPGLSLALMALLLALGVNIGVGTMVGSFRATFLGWLDGRLAAEAYVRAGSEDEAARIARWLEDRPEVTAVLPSREVETRIEGWPTELRGVNDHPTYRESWPLLDLAPNGWERFAAGEAALVSEQLARRTGTWTGDRIRLDAPGGEWSLAVAGVYPDYGNPRGEVRVVLAALEELWPGAEVGATGIRAAPESVPGLLADLAAELGVDPSNMIDQAALKAESTAIFERTFTVTAALNTLTLGVAGVALLTSLMTLSGQRLPQVAPLWALGVTRRRLAGIEILRMVVLALMTAVLAIPLGIGVAWMLVAVVNVEAFGWRLPLYLFPADWAALVGLALAAAFLAALSPVLRLARTPPARLLRIFADER